MNIFTKICFWFGIACFLAAIAVQVVMMVQGASIEDFYRSDSSVLTVVGLLVDGCMWVGVILLVEAVVWLGRNWQHLHQSTKVLSVLALLCTSIFGSYIFHYLIPRLQSEQSSGTA